MTEVIGVTIVVNGCRTLGLPPRRSGAQKTGGENYYHQNWWGDIASQEMGMGELDNMVVVVTGASSGIGAATAEAWSAPGRAWS